MAVMSISVIEPASPWRRFFNLMIDSVVFLVLMFVLGMLGAGRAFEDSSVARFMFSLTIQFLYYLVFEAWLQRTPAKFVTGTRVVTADGGKPTLATVAVRSLVRLVPFDAISIYTGKDEDKKRTWWHDRWSATRVVRTKASP